MLKRTLLAALAFGFVAAVSVPVHAATTVMDGTSCRDAAKAKFPDNRSMRNAYRKECKAAWKAAKSGNKTRGFLFFKRPAAA